MRVVRTYSRAARARATSPHTRRAAVQRGMDAHKLRFYLSFVAAHHQTKSTRTRRAPRTSSINDERTPTRNGGRKANPRRATNEKHIDKRELAQREHCARFSHGEQGPPFSHRAERATRRTRQHGMDAHTACPCAAPREVYWPSARHRRRHSTPGTREAPSPQIRGPHPSIHLRHPMAGILGIS